MKITKSFENYIAVIMMGVALCFSFFIAGVTAAHAEETSDTNSDTSSDTEVVSAEEAAKRVEMKKKIEELRAIIETKKAEFKARQEANKEEFKEKREEAKDEFEDKREETKAEFKINKEEFLSSLDGLSEDEKRVKMLEFIQNIKTVIEARKAEMKSQMETRKEEVKSEMEEKKAKFEVIKDEFKSDRDEFKSSLEGMTKEQKIAAIMKRI